APDRRRLPAARDRCPLRPRPRRRRDDQQRRPLAAPAPAVEGAEEVVEGARDRSGQEGLRLVAPRDALLADPRGREVPGRPVPRRWARMLLEVPSSPRLGLGASPPG